MRNIFIIHTQYNLIFACGIVKSMYENDENILVLHAEFKLERRIVESLKKCFSDIVVIQNGYYSPKKYLEREKHLLSEYNAAKRLFRLTFDAAFISQDELIDTIILTKIRKSPEFKCIGIEEDAYFSLDTSRNHLSAKSAPYKPASKKQKLFYYTERLLFGKNTFRYAFHCYGMSPIYNGMYLLYPQFARSELAGKELLELTNEMLLAGTGELYGYDKKTVLPGNTENSVLILFDLIRRYKNKDATIGIINELISICMKKNIRVLCKYHPRETEKLEVVNGNTSLCEVNQLTPSEKILSDLYGEKLFVVGNLSTSIQVAAKMGFTTISIAKIEANDNVYALECLHKMGICFPESIDEMRSIIEGEVGKTV